MSGRDASHLSRDPPYGYDVVVGMTQASVDATLKQYLRHHEAPMVELCYVEVEDNVYEIFSVEEFQKRAKGTNPFDIANGTPMSNQAVKNVYDADFKCGLRIQLGISSEFPASKVPNIISLEGGTHQVGWKMICSTFNITAINYEKRNFLNISQPEADPWIFESNVDLRLIKQEEASWKKLPKPVQDQIEKFEDEYEGQLLNVETLLFDLNKAFLASTPTIPALKGQYTVQGIVQDFFIGEYMRELKKKGSPLFGVVIVPEPPKDERKEKRSPLKISSLRYWVNDYMGSDGQPVPTKTITSVEQECRTLNYLCSTNNERTVPAAYAMNWNWVPTSDLRQYHGVMAINRQAFADWFVKTLGVSVAKKNSIMVIPDVSFNILKGWRYTSKVYWDNEPTLTRPKTGEMVVMYTWDHEYEDKGNDTHLYKCKNHYHMHVSFIGDTIRIIQNQYWYVSAKEGIPSNYADVVNKTVTDTWALDVDSEGKLVYKHSTKTDDKSWNYDFSFITGIKQDVAWIRDSIGGKITTVKPPESVSKFFFPGGNTFAFRSARFSANQDLVATIMYKDPSAEMQFMPHPEDYEEEEPRPRRVRIEDTDHLDAGGSWGNMYRKHKPVGAKLLVHDVPVTSNGNK